RVMERAHVGDTGVDVQMLVLAPGCAILNRFWSAFEVNGKTGAFADGIESAPCRTEREAEHVAIERNSPIEVIHQQLRREGCEEGLRPVHGCKSPLAINRGWAVSAPRH